jgi:hypothetical protein
VCSEMQEWAAAENGKNVARVCRQCVQDSLSGRIRSLLPVLLVVI